MIGLGKCTFSLSKLCLGQIQLSELLAHFESLPMIGTKHFVISMKCYLGR
jgi:hypothetical protein